MRGVGRGEGCPCCEGERLESHFFPNENRIAGKPKCLLPVSGGISFQDKSKTDPRGVVRQYCKGQLDLVSLMSYL
jgi:hypothetical protein